MVHSGDLGTPQSQLPFLDRLRRVKKHTDGKTCYIAESGLHFREDSVDSRVGMVKSQSTHLDENAITLASHPLL